jgi:hypothetical protein
MKLKYFKEFNKLNENAFKSGDKYRVKLIKDIPSEIINNYIQKVKQETNENALKNFTENDLAELLVMHVIDNYLKIENLPSSIAVDVDEKETVNNEEDNFEQEDEDEDFDIEGDVDDTPDVSEDDIEFETEEADEDENIEI